ncbi:unnamed protein product, partial [Nippostrongylus brasiliensis]|uniref:Transcriptional regulator n=1 Tax=Nippostrongylus brasiliensis TaxID=27835 RepID=A0A0N4YBY1_NIPBR
TAGRRELWQTAEAVSRAIEKKRIQGAIPSHCLHLRIKRCECGHWFKAIDAYPESV